MIKFKHSMCLSFGGTGAACPCRTGTCLCRFRNLPGTARQKKKIVELSLAKKLWPLNTTTKISNCSETSTQQFEKHVIPKQLFL